MRCIVVSVLAMSLLCGSALAKAKPTVAVLYFDYEGKDEEMQMLRKGLAQMLISDLSDNDAYQIVERARLQEILDELKLNQTKKIDKKTASQIGKLLGARYMVLGGYFDMMGTLRVDARVVEVETGKVLKSVGSHGKPDSFIDLEKKLSDELSGILTTSLSTAPQRKNIQSKKRSHPKKLSVKTALLYSKALDAKDRGDSKSAKAQMKKVVEAQPDFSLAQLDLDALVQ